MRRLRLTMREIEQVRKMAAVGLKPTVMAYVLGLSSQGLRDLLKRDRDLIRAGKKPKPENLYVAMQVGRSMGDAQLMQVAFEVATKDRNVTMLLHLLRTRLGQVDGGDAKKKPGDAPLSIIFETQIGDNGTIRASEKPLELPPAEQSHEDDGKGWLE